MVKIYDSYDDLCEEDEEWYDEEDEEVVLVVRFNSSKENYHYYTNNLDYEKGEKLKIISLYGDPTTVTVVGYCNSTTKAKKPIKVISKIKTHKPNKYKKKEQDMKKSNLMANTKEAMTEAKNAAIKFQKGAAVITAIKTALNESDLIPESGKMLIAAGGGITDLIFGLLLQVSAETFTDSKIIQDASKSANFAGAISTSIGFTAIQDLIEKIVGSAVVSINKKTVKETPEADTTNKETKTPKASKTKTEE